jgi:hypothetical protein
MAGGLSKGRSRHRRERTQWRESHRSVIGGSRSATVIPAFESVVISSTEGDILPFACLLR